MIIVNSRTVDNLAFQFDTLKRVANLIMQIFVGKARFLWFTLGLQISRLNGRALE